MVYEMLDSEGLYMGASSALNVVAAEELAKKLGPGKSFIFQFVIIMLLLCSTFLDFRPPFLVFERLDQSLITYLSIGKQDIPS